MENRICRDGPLDSNTRLATLLNRRFNFVNFFPSEEPAVARMGVETCHCQPRLREANSSHLQVNFDDRLVEEWLFK